MKIAYVIINANRREGTSRAVVEVAERMAKEHEVHLWARCAEDFDRQRIELRRVPGPTKPAVLDLVSFARWCDRRLLAENYDLIHCAGVNTRHADVYTVQTVQPEKVGAMKAVSSDSGAGIARRTSRWLYDQSVIRGEELCYRAYGNRGVRGFAPVAQGVAQELKRHYPVSDAEVAIIPNAADTLHFTPEKRTTVRTEILKRHLLDPDDFILLFAGGEWRRKGLELAIRALAKIPDPSVKLVVAGTDPVSHELEALPATLGVAARTVFAGYCTDIDAYYAASDLFVFPSAYEAFSLATIEAAASGLPVLMPPISGSAELLSSGEAGIVIDRTPESIAEAVVSVRSSLHRHAELRDGARRIVERCYTWDRVAEQTAALYTRVLDRRARESAKKTIL